MSPYPLLVALGLVFTWWGWKTGAFFGDVAIPGGILLAGILAALIVRAPLQAEVRGPARVALLSLLGLAGWTLLSFFWTPAREVAVADTERVLIYLLVFALGGWLALLLGREMALASAPVIVAAAAVGLATTISVATADDAGRYLDLDGLLSYPLGYRNAVAAFFMVCSLPALALLPRPEIPWPLRSAMAATVTISVGLMVLTQSRGAAIAVVAGLAAVVLLSRSKLGALSWVAVAVIPALFTLPVLLDVYAAAPDGIEGAVDELNLAGTALLLAAAVSAGLAGVYARHEHSLVLAPWVRRRVGAGVIALVAVAVMVPSVLLVARDGGPVSFVDKRFDELSAGSPEVGEGGSRLKVNFATDRGTLWGVALDDVAAAPVLGEGAGGFEYSFLAERTDPDKLTSEDPHGVPFLMLSELGLVGFSLFAALCLGAVLACWRSRRLGPSAAVLSAAALSSFAYWIVHASVDWFWHYPGVTAPVVMLLGAASAPALRTLEPVAIAPRLKAGLIGALAIVAAIQVPLFLSEHYLRAGIETGASDPTSAYEDLGLAADLNPWAAAPLIAEGQVAAAAGEDQRALGAFSEASKRKEIDWTPHFLAAQVLAGTDAAQARAELEEARRLNPQGARIIEAEAVLDAGEDPQTGP